MALVYQETRAKAVCSLKQNVFVLLNDDPAGIKWMPAVLFRDFYLR